MSDSRPASGGLIAGIVIGVIAGAAAVVGYRSYVASSEPAPEPAVEQPADVAPEEPAPPVVAVAPAPVPVPADEPEVEAMAEAPPEPEPPEPESNPGQERTERIVQAQLKMVTDMVYKPFYEEVAMDADTQAAASELFLESFSAQQKLQQAAMGKGDRIASEVKAETDALRDELRDKLSNVFNEDQLASWEEYDAYSDRVLYEALLDGQLRMLAPNLSIESHQATMALMAEELAQSIEAFEASSATYNLDSFNDAQLAGLNAAMDQLQLELDAEQAAHAQGFIDQVKVMFDAMKSPPAQP